MSTAVAPIRMHHHASASSCTTTPVGNKSSVFTKTTKYDPSVMGLSKGLSTQTSLLDVIRSQGPVMLGVEDRVQPRGPLVSTAVAPLRKEQPMSSCNDCSKPKSKPIRILASHHHAHHAEGTDEEDPLSTSAELERFYDTATWRMYILIQSARLANDSALPTSTPGHGRVPTTPLSHAPYRPHPSHTTAPPTWTTQCPSSATTDPEEDIFDLEL